MKILRYSALMVLSGLLAAPASAQRDQRKQEPHERQGQPRQREAQPRQQPQPRQQAPREQQREQAQPRQQAQPRAQAQPRQQIQPRVEPRAQVQPRVEGHRAVGTRGVAVPRPEIRGRAYIEPRTYGYARPRASVPVIVYPRRYYSFRPRFSLGFGIYLGYPIAYPYDFGYPTYVYGAPAGYNITPGAYGGVSFDVQPDNADVVVDGSFVGIARDFGPLRQPLTLIPGRHHIELQAAGLEPLAFDVDVIGGEVIPFRGTLLPY